MSFAGHVWDMIRRDKENRALLNRRREQRKEILRKYNEKEISPYEPDITLEEFEEIDRHLKQRDKDDKRYYARMLLIFLAVALLVVFIIILLVF